MIDKLDELSRNEQFSQSSATKDLKPIVRPNWGKIPSVEYLNTYGKLSTLSKANFHKNVFANGAAAHSTPLISRSSMTLYPGVYSFDPRTLAFQRELVKQLNEAFEPDPDSEGFTKTGIHTNFDRLKCPAGYFMNPMSYTTVNNKLYREKELGLRCGMSDRDKAIATEVWHLVWKEATVRPVNVAKLSTSGMRRFTHDVQWKLAFAEWVLEPANFEEVLDAIASDDTITLANKFEMVWAMYIQKRGQVDHPDKVRMVFDLEYALSGGLEGREFAADKKVFIDVNGTLVAYEDFSAVRARVVQAGPWTVNCFLQICATSAMYSLFSRFGSTFHINTAEQIKEVTTGKYVYCSDVTEYDRSMDIADLRLQHDCMREYWDERIVKASWRLYVSAYYSKPLSLGGTHGAWVGDPTDWSQELHSGNRSGHALTSITAKVQKVIDTLIVIDRMYPVVGHVKRFLEGKGPVQMVNNGDDEVILFNSKADLERFKVLRADRQIGRYVVEPELGQGFSGLLLTRDPAAPLSYEPKAKIHTTFEKLWVPERSIGGLHRQFWTIGVIDRVTNITSTDIGRRAWEIHMRVYRDMMSPHHGDFMSVLMREHSKVNLDLQALTRIDREVLDDPSKIHYKFADDEVSPEVLETVTSKIPPPVVYDFLKRYYKGLIV